MQTNNEGYTITELLVALLIGSLIIGFCFTAYEFSQRIYSVWNKKNEIERNSNFVFQTIAFDIERAKEVKLYHDSLSMLLIGNKHIVYRFDQGNLWRNEVQLNNDGYSVSVDVAEEKEIFSIAIRSTTRHLSYSVSGTAEYLRSSKEAFIVGLK